MAVCGGDMSFPRNRESSPPLPWRERPAWPEATPKAGPAAGATVSSLRKQEQVSFLRKQQSSTPLPTAGEAGGAQGTAG